MISTDIGKAAALLSAGDVVAIPTETVYGLAANIYDEKAIRRIFEAKGRPLFNPLIVHIASVDQLPLIAKDIPGIAWELAEHFCPGPLTMVLPKQDTVPGLVTGGKPTVAVRIPDHPVTLELLRRIDFPLAAPSANPFGMLSPTCAEHVEAGLGNAIPMILDGGPCNKGIESTIIGFPDGDPVVYRLGSISLEQIESVTGPLPVFNKNETGPPAPGMLDKHYSPGTTLILTDDMEACCKKEYPEKTGLLVLCRKPGMYPGFLQVPLTDSGNLDEAAKNLYGRLHELDMMGLNLIIAERMPDKGLGRSINDRLERAAKK